MALKKSEKRLLIGLAIVAVISAGVLYRVYNPPVKDVIASQAPTSETKKETKASTSTKSRSTSGGGGSRSGGGTSVPSSAGQKVSQADFEKHATMDNCWVLMEGEVYDITIFLLEYVSQQDKASSFCGTVGFEAGFIDGDLGLKDSVKNKSQKMGIIG